MFSLIIFFYNSFSSLCAFSNAITFKTINDEDINCVEQFVQSELDLLINFRRKCQISEDEKQTIFDEKDKIHFYGEYVSNPHRFQFSVVERKMIEFLVSHVKYVVDAGGINNHICHFTRNELNEEKLEDVSQIGNYFCDISNKSEEVNIEPTKTHYFLNMLIGTADKNAKRDKHGYRYTDEIKRFTSYFRMLSGPFAYETIQRNLECAFPTLQSINRYIRCTNCKVIEGILRCEELLQYLKERQLPLVVSLSEDATRIEERVQYDSNTNQVIGFVLPISEETGMPIPYSFKARNADEIFKHFGSGNQAAHFVNVFMAQPLAKVAPFCLLIFGSN